MVAVVPIRLIEEAADLSGGSLAWTGPCPPSAIHDAICRSGLSWLITDATGQPLAYGQTRRYATDAQRAALAVRDGGCRWPGCTSQPRYTIAHHEPPHGQPGWATDLDRMALLCGFHHGLRHHGGWMLTLGDDATVTITSPDRTVVRTETAAQARFRHGQPLSDGPSDATTGSGSARGSPGAQLRASPAPPGPSGTATPARNPAAGQPATRPSAGAGANPPSTGADATTLPSTGAGVAAPQDAGQIGLDLGVHAQADGEGSGGGEAPSFEQRTPWRQRDACTTAGSASGRRPDAAREHRGTYDVAGRTTRPPARPGGNDGARQPRGATTRRGDA